MGGLRQGLGPAACEDDADQSLMSRERWADGPPHELFRHLRRECPVHWTPAAGGSSGSRGFWSVTTAEDARRVSRDWRTYSSRRDSKLMRSMFIGMDPPKHDRIKALFQTGFTPKRIAGQEEMVRRVVAEVFDRIEGRQAFDLVEDVARPAVTRVIGSFMGIPREEDDIWAELMNATLNASDPDLYPDGGEGPIAATMPEIFRRCRRMIEARRARPTDDLTSVLIHAEIDGERLREHEIVMGMVLLLAAGTDSTKATYCSGMRALIEDPDQRRLLVEDPSLIPGAVEESLRMFPAFSHFPRTATRDTELHGQAIRRGDRLALWYPSTNRDESRYESPDRFDVLRAPEHQAFGAGGRHFCLGAALARLELRILFEATLSRYPELELNGEPEVLASPFLNQLKTLPVKL